MQNMADIKHEVQLAMFGCCHTRMKNIYLPLPIFQSISIFSLSSIQTSQLGSRDLYGMNKNYQLN